MKIHLIPTLLSSVLAFSGAATAGDMMKKGTEPGAEAPDYSQTGSTAGATTPEFNQLDSDGDGYVSRSDVQEHDELANRWEQLDTNADQQLDRAEFSAFENMASDTGADPGAGTDPGISEPGGTDPGMGTDRYQEGTDTIR
jgi:hypothetical protein